MIIFGASPGIDNSPAPIGFIFVGSQRLAALEPLRERNSVRMLKKRTAALLFVGIGSLRLASFQLR